MGLNPALGDSNNRTENGSCPAWKGEKKEKKKKGRAVGGGHGLWPVACQCIRIGGGYGGYVPRYLTLPLHASSGPALTFNCTQVGIQWAGRSSRARRFGGEGCSNSCSSATTSGVTAGISVNELPPVTGAYSASPLLRCRIAGAPPPMVWPIAGQPSQLPVEPLSLLAPNLRNK